MSGLLDIYPRARHSAYRLHDGPEDLICARCSAERWGLPALWRALHRIVDPPRLEARPLAPVLLEHPGACCSACGQSFWHQLPHEVDG